MKMLSPITKTIQCLWHKDSERRAGTKTVTASKPSQLIQIQRSQLENTSCGDPGIPVAYDAPVLLETTFVSLLISYPLLLVISPVIVVDYPVTSGYQDQFCCFLLLMHVDTYCC